VPLSRPRLVLGAVIALAVACLSAAVLQLLPRVRLGGVIEGVQWVQAAGSMFWALPLAVFVIVGAGGMYVLAVELQGGRMLTAGLVGAGAVIGAGGFVGVGTPWYELADGVSGESLRLGVAAFVAMASIHLLVSTRAIGATRPGATRPSPARANSAGR
jgi:hypothetical protein